MTWRPEPLPSLEGVTDVYFDTETTGLKWRRKVDKPVALVVKPKGGKSVYIPFGHRGGGNHPEEQVKAWARRELRGKHIRGANTRFDIHEMIAWDVDLREQGCTFTDIQHTAALLDDTRRRFALDILGKDFLGEGKVKTLSTGQLIDPTRMAEYHAGEVAPYGCHDVDMLEELDAVMQPLIDADGLRKVHDLEDSIIPVVVEMEQNMAPLDMDLLHDWVHRSEQEYKKIIWNLSRDFGFQVDPGKNDVMQRVFDKLKLPIVFTTEKGAPSFADAVLKMHCDPKFPELYRPELVAIRRAIKLASLRSKYLVPYLAEQLDGFLPYDLHQLRGDEYGTISGRFSSSNRNIQQVMSVDRQREALGDDYIIRELFIAEHRAKGTKVIASDAKQIEFRIFGHYANSHYINEAYRKDIDADFHNVVRDMVINMLPGITRKPVKNLNFAKIYGAGFDKIVMMTGLAPDKAQEFIDVYDRTFPEVKNLLKYASRLAKDRGYVKTYLGRRSRCSDRPHKALNAVIQGTAADIMKRKLRELYDLRKSIGVIMRMTVHDEFVGEGDEAAEREVNKVLNFQSTPMKIDILWDTGSADTWAAA